MKCRSIWWFVVVLAVALVVPGVASAKSEKTGMMEDTVQVGADLGLNIFGTIPFASGKFEGEDATFSGSGNFGPAFGVHVNGYFAREWIGHLDVGYFSQSGSADVNFDNADLEDQEFDWVMNVFRLSIGGGRSLFSSKDTRLINPYFLVGLGLYGVYFRDQDEDDSASGQGLGPWGLIGVDGQIMRKKNYKIVGGLQLRGDLIVASDLSMDGQEAGKETEISLGYFPVALIVTGGVQF
ncbi:MAG: hypothetical protein H6684_16865 [Deltaproteobacteria bacterium]|nr:hypothetical protein [Deltaproteobacteria bacterium]MCB9479194.1 hypothetical protein [Deltaproteobacteria bacterium]MCB9490407.1 hypothetical protein [Deltaproteobacteria bacterium]